MLSVKHTMIKQIHFTTHITKASDPNLTCTSLEAGGEQSRETVRYIELIFMIKNCFHGAI